MVVAAHKIWKRRKLYKVIILPRSISNIIKDSASHKVKKVIKGYLIPLVS